MRLRAAARLPVRVPQQPLCDLARQGGLVGSQPHPLRGRLRDREYKRGSAPAKLPVAPSADWAHVPRLRRVQTGFRSARLLQRLQQLVHQALQSLTQHHHAKRPQRPPALGPTQHTRWRRERKWRHSNVSRTFVRTLRGARTPQQASTSLCSTVLRWAHSSCRMPRCDQRIGGTGAISRAPQITDWEPACPANPRCSCGGGGHAGCCAVCCSRARWLPCGSCPPFSRDGGMA